MVRLAKKNEKIIDAYHRSLQAYVTSKVEVIHALLEHQAEKGFANEEVLREILRDFLSSRYGIHSGFLLDTSGSLSPQTDIIITDELGHPKIFSKLAPMLHPIDSAIATIEVKTTLNLKELRKSIAAVKQTRSSMKMISKKKGRLTPLGKQPIYVVGPPMSVIFAYSQSGWKTVNGLLQTFQNEFKDVPNSQRVDLVYVLDQALIIGWTLPKAAPTDLFRPCCSAEVKASPDTISKLPYVPHCLIPEDVSKDFTKLNVDESGVGLMTFLQILLKFLNQSVVISPDKLVSKYAPNPPLLEHRFIDPSITDEEKELYDFKE